MTLLHWLDLLLALGMTLRVIRFIVTDDLGGWMIRHPIQRWYLRKPGPPSDVLPYYDGTIRGRVPFREKIVTLVHCPYCTSFWIGGAVLLSLLLVGGPGDAAEPWRWVTGWWTLAYVAPHIGARLGDTDGDADD